VKFGSVLVTGGSGTFGRAFVRRLLRDDAVGRVCVFSRGEHAQASMRRDLHDHPAVRWFIGDVRDQQRLKRAMEGCDLVVHAAALKRIEVAEYNPIEVVRTNVDGAINVIEAATDAGVKKVVALSSDKAVQPVNAYGASKLMAEKLFIAANATRGKRGPIFACTRYGNIAGSAGSVIPKWRELGSRAVVGMTDPECTRYWMTIEQAVDLVLDTCRHMTGGEVNIPTLPAYRLGDLAEAMLVQYAVLGLPAYEKMHETMDGITTSEQARRMSIEELRSQLETV